MPAALTLSLTDLAVERRLRSIYEQHSRLAALCDDLETIADDLPRACPQRCRRAVESLESMVAEHHAAEIDTLRELLAEDRSDLLERIVHQHGEDEGLAAEIASALEPAVAGGVPEDPETLGYMLRCFFNNYRRSMLVEELAIRSATSGTAR